MIAMANQGTKIAYGFVRQWIAYQRERIDTARKRGDHRLASLIEHELHRRLGHGKR